MSGSIANTYLFLSVNLRNVKNVILFGETGVGKSSVINLMAGREVAQTSSDLPSCTLHAEEYAFTFPGGTEIRIFDTVGLEGPDMGVKPFMDAIVEAHQLVTSLHRVGGVDLLLFCVRGGRITKTTRRTYQLFYEVLCGSDVPLAVIVTHLEGEENVMEDWWVRNEKWFGTYKINRIDAHACITAVSADAEMHVQRRADSQKILRDMLLDLLGNKCKAAYVQEPTTWFLAIVQMLRSLLKEALSSWSHLVRRNPLNELKKMLVKDCKLSPAEAQMLAQMVIKARERGMVPQSL